MCSPWKTISSRVVASTNPTPIKPASDAARRDGSNQRANRPRGRPNVSAVMFTRVVLASRLSARLAVMSTLIEPAADLFVAQQTLLQANLQEERQRRADERTGTDPQLSHHLRSIELRSDGRQLLALGQLGDAGLEFVHALRQDQRLAL